MNTLFVLLSLTFGWIILPSKVFVFAIQVYEHQENDLTTASTVLMMITPSTTTTIPTSTPLSSIIIANSTIESLEVNSTDNETLIQSNSNKTANKTDQTSDKLKTPVELLQIESNINATGPVQYPTNEPLHTPRIAEPFLNSKHHQIDQQQKSTIAHHINHKKFIPSPQLSTGIINSPINYNNKRENFLPSNQYYKPPSYEPYYNYKIPATIPTTPPTTIKPINTKTPQEMSHQSSQQSIGKQIEINDGFIVSSGPYYPKFDDIPNQYQHHHQHFHDLSKPKINWPISSSSPQQSISPIVATPPSGPGGTTIICDPPQSTLQFPENGKWYWLPNSTPEIPIIPEKPLPTSSPSPPPQASAVSTGGTNGGSFSGAVGGGSTTDAWKWIFENNTPKLVPNHHHHHHHSSYPHHHQLTHSSHPYSFEVISTAGPPTQGSPFNFPAGGEIVPQPPSYGSGGIEFSEWPSSLPPAAPSSHSLPSIPPQFLQQYFLKEEKNKPTEENTGKESDDADDGDNEESGGVKTSKKKPNLRPKGLSPLKKILSVLGIALPIGLLISTLTPQVVVVSPNSTSSIRPLLPGSNLGVNDSLRSKYDHNNYLNNGFFHKSLLHRSVDNGNNNNNNNMDGIRGADINQNEFNIENIQLNPNELDELDQNLSEKNPLIEFLTILDKQHNNIQSSVHNSGGSIGGSSNISADDAADAANKHECDSRQFCEVARLGSTPNANVLNRMLWKVANKTSKSQAIKSGLYEIFRAIRNNNCKVFICKNYQPYQTLQQINQQNVSSQQQLPASSVQQYPQQYQQP